MLIHTEAADMAQKVDTATVIAAIDASSLKVK
jgi:hypothetical protein